MFQKGPKRTDPNGPKRGERKDIIMDYNIIKEKMNKSIDNLREKFAEVRAGRANPAILNKVKIDYYGTPTPINQVAGVSVPEARMIVIQPYISFKRNRKSNFGIRYWN